MMPLMESLLAGFGRYRTGGVKAGAGAKVAPAPHG